MDFKVFDNFPDSVVITNEKGDIVYSNGKIEKIFGYEHSEIINKNVKIFLPKELISKHDNYIKKYLDTKVAKIIGIGREVEAIKKNGDPLPIYLSLGHIDTPSFKGFVANLHSLESFYYVIKKLKISEQYLKEKNDEIISQTKQTRQLVHLLCHDLTNPISVCKTYSELLIEGYPNKEIYYKKIEQSSLRALDIIDSVRHLMAAEEGKVTIDLEFHNLKSMLVEALEFMELKLKEKNIKINLIANDKISVLCSKTLLISSVFNNLLSNAIKFSPKDSTITINVSETLPKINIEFIDQGIGIPKELLENIFSQDQPTTRFGTEGEKGTGFGMPLVKKFIEAFEGRIKIESKCVDQYPKEHGTKITVLLWGKT